MDAERQFSDRPYEIPFWHSQRRDSQTRLDISQINDPPGRGAGKGLEGFLPSRRRKVGGVNAGNYFDNTFTKVADPQCSAIASSLQSLCTLNAVADSSGNIVLRNPAPGTLGNLGRGALKLN